MNNTATQKNTPALTELLAFDSLPEAEQAAMVDEIGGLVLQSALLVYLVDRTPDEQKQFEQFIDAQADNEKFLELLLAAYPDFAIVLTNEAEALQKEMSAVLAVE
jgi:hypothetical protein